MNGPKQPRSGIPPPKGSRDTAIEPEQPAADARMREQALRDMGVGVISNAGGRSEQPREQRWSTLPADVDDAQDRYERGQGGGGNDAALEGQRNAEEQARNSLRELNWRQKLDPAILRNSTGDLSPAEFRRQQDAPVSYEVLRGMERKDVRGILAKTIEKLSNRGKKSIEWTGDKMKAASGYLGESYAKGNRRLLELLHLRKKEEAPQSPDGNPEKAKALSKFLKDHYKENYGGKKGLEKGKQLGVDLVGLAKAYNKLPFKTKMIVAGVCLGISGGFALAGLATSGLTVGGVLLGARRAFAGLAGGIAMEATLQKVGVKNTTVRYLLAGGFGVAVGSGALAHAGKELWSEVGGKEWLAHMFGYGGGTSDAGAVVPAASHGLKSALGSGGPVSASAEYVDTDAGTPDIWKPHLTQEFPRIDVEGGPHLQSPEDVMKSVGDMPNPSESVDTPSADAAVVPDSGDSVATAPVETDAGTPDGWKPDVNGSSPDTGPHLSTDIEKTWNDVPNPSADSALATSPDVPDAAATSGTSDLPPIGPRDYSNLPDFPPVDEHPAHAPLPNASGIHHASGHHMHPAPHHESAAPAVDYEKAETDALNSKPVQDWIHTHPGQPVPQDILHANMPETHAAPADIVSSHAAPTAHTTAPLESAHPAGRTFTTLGDFSAEQGHQPPAPQTFSAPAPPVAPSGGRAFTTLGDFNAHGAEVTTPTALPVETPVQGVNTFTHSPSWIEYHNSDALKLMTSDPVSAGLPEQVQTFRSGLFDLIRESGLGPTDGEPLEKFIARATEHIHDPAAGITHPTVFELPDHTYAVRGGDISARSILANEYALRVNPAATHVYVDINGRGEALDFNKRALEGHRLVSVKVNPDVTGAKTVF